MFGRGWFLVWAWWCWCSGNAARVSPSAEWEGGAPTMPKYTDTGYNMADVYTTAFLNVTFYDARGVRSNNPDELNFEKAFAGSGPINDCGRRPMEGKFGDGHISSAYGQLVHIASQGPADDHSGCERPLNATFQPIPNGPWIALIKRGRCNFDDKVQNAFESRAVGVLIYNDRDSPSLDKMKLSTNRNRNISAVFTYKYKGEELAKHLDNGAKIMLQITVATYCVQNPNTMNRTSVLFVSISFIILMVMSLSWLVFYYIQRFRYMNAKDRLSKRLCCAAKKALSKIPIKNLKSEDKEIQGDGECCAVCIEPYKISDILRVLPCKHDFHKSCIDPWLLEHRTCPMCKMDILKYYGFVFTGSQESILQLDTDETDRRNAGGTSPLPHQASRASSYEVAHSERSSRASSPDEMTPSLQQSLPSSTSHDLPLYNAYPSLSMSDPALYSSGKRTLPGVHTISGNTAGISNRQPVETTVISSEHIDDNELRDSV